MRKLVSLLLACVMILSVGTALAAKVGVAMPTNSLQRWNQDGANMKAQLEAAGYEVDLQYANNDVATQVSQLENMILGGAEVLVIASIDGSALGTVLQTAKDNDIKVIAYDRMLTDTPNVDYYATFDNYKVGAIQGQFIIDTLDLENAEGPFNFEFFAGSPDDSNARYFHAGAWDLLKPYYESGKILVKSGQVDFETIAILGWGTDDAQARMDNLLTGYADGTVLDAVLSPNDSLALGITNSLQAAGYTLDNFPLVTGQDCDVTNTKNIILGYQAMSVFKDTRTLAAEVVKMVDAILKGEEVVINDTTTYDNGVFVIPTNLSVPVFADANNYKELLIDSGYYTEEQLAID